MLDSLQLAPLESKLGYSFKNKQLLVMALTHGSFGSDSNKLFALLGEAAIRFVLSKQLVKICFGNVDEITRMRSYIYCKETMLEIALALNLRAFLRCGNGLKFEAQFGGIDSACAHAVTALAGAMVEDGGSEALEAFARKFLFHRIKKVGEAETKQPKTYLQELLQAKGYEVPRYEVVEQTGPPHNPTFTVGIFCGDQFKVSGQGRSRKKAEQQAAQNYIKILTS